MSLATTPTGLTAGQDASLLNHLQVPDSLQKQLGSYRRRVWTIKLVEATAIALFVAAVAFLTAYLLDRFTDTPAIVRGGLLFVVLAAAAIIPVCFHRWVWSQRTLTQLARLLSRQLPAVGDSLLGVIELAENHREQSRSPALCQAAMRQVAADANQRNLLTAVPRSRYRSWSIAAGLGVLVALGLFFVYPAAASNALARLAAPWSEISRYTFTRVDQLPAQWHVAHGEPVTLSLSLTEQSKWQPAEGIVQIGGQQPIKTELVNGGYQFILPPQIETQPLDLRIGDTIQQVNLVPTLRPELMQIAGQVRLPEYLGLPTPIIKDARGGAVSLVKGSQAVFQVEASRELVKATINGKSQQPNGNQFSSAAVLVADSSELRLEWQDEHELAGREPFNLQITAIDDESPSLICDGLPRQAVVLDSQQLSFQVQVHDDFGVRRVGVMWRGLPNDALAQPTSGERVLAAGGNDQASMEVIGTFSATSYGIEPQAIELFVWAEDYRPENARVISSPYMLYVLTPDQHAIWMTEQLSKWHRQALEVRDRELQLYESNKELRDLPSEDRNIAENRQRIERQAQAERANGRRLARLGELGDQLVKQASRNPEIGVGHLDRWADMLQILKDVSANRMPSVADLLDQAADEPSTLAQQAPKPSGPVAGQDRSKPTPGSPSKQDPNAKPSNKIVPQLVDRESSQNTPGELPADEAGPPKKPSDPALRLPTTTLVGPAKKPSPKPDEQPPAADSKLAEAVTEQEDLLAEFEKIADELNAVLANLEGSTLVKRLKAASRTQSMVAGRISDHIESAFGRRESRLTPDVNETLTGLQKVEDQSVQEVSYIMDDMSAYFERRRFARFQTVLQQMKEEDVIGGLRQLTSDISSQQGLSVAQCEYWSDTLDRWAEDLVDPACSGQCPGGKSPASLPPSIVLEALKILEAEINLREETRVAEQAREAVSRDDHMQEGLRLSDVQVQLQNRVVDLLHRIEELPDAQKHFGKELKLLAQVDVVMGEALRLLAEPNTGPAAIAAETEAIELLLQSKRINPKSGGGGGSSPGGGGSGTTTDSALALLGSGTNQKEVREDRNIGQTTGETGTVLPEEFRAGLDEYFNRIEQPIR